MKKQEKVEEVVEDDKSSEPSEFVDEREEEGDIFEGEEELSEYESLEGDPEGELSFSDE